MKTKKGNFTLTPDQIEFKKMLEKTPRIESFWDFDKRECDVDGLRQSLGTLSTGEAIMGKFLAGVWLGENTLGFDMIEACKSLDDKHLKIITGWVNNPAFP